MGKKKRYLPQRKNADGRNTMNIILQALVLNALIAWVFYNSVFGLLLFPVVFVFCKKNQEKKIKMKFDESFDREFKDMLVAVSDALQSGYSIENAFKDAQENIRIMYGQNGLILNDLKQMNAKISMHISAESAMNDFAEKYPTEEAVGFAGVFSFARRLSGGYVNNLKHTVEKMEDKLELKQDIRAAIAQKQMEFNVMCIMPIAILVYVKLTSDDFLSNIYGNITGVTVMSICLGIYLGAYYLGKKIVDIKV